MVILCRMRRLIDRLASVLWDIERAEANATKITATITGMPRGSGNNSKVESGAIRLTEVKAAYRETINELEQMKEELNPLIDTINDDDDRAAMRLRYIDWFDPERIAKARHRSIRSIYYYLSRGENELIRKYPDKVMK